MYSVLPSFILGFHGCDEALAEKVFSGKMFLKPSQNDYDWLGQGVYFWENNPRRALEYAKHLKKHPEQCKETIKKPAVIGAVIDLGRCLNLLDSTSIELVAEAYTLYEKSCAAKGQEMAENKNIKGSKDLLLRYRDCAVIDTLHTFRSANNERPFDSVRGMFMEGSPIYKGAGFHDKSHIQVCVCNPDCIKGYFRPIKKESADW
jgi:hypothetical protein